MSRGDERLGEIFRDPPPGFARGDDCPPPERAYEVVHGEVSAEERIAFATHAATCPGCATEWRLARAYADETGSAVPATVPRGARRWPWITAAAAAIGAIALVSIFLSRDGALRSVPALRSTARTVVHSTIPDNASLPREAFRLGWDSPGPDFRYDLRVFDGRLRLLHEERGLEVPEATVPPDALRSLGPEAVVLWQVEAIDSEGNRLQSGVFRVRIAR